MAFSGEQLKSLREQTGLSQYKLSLECNVEYDIIFRLERGDRIKPSFETVEKLADTLKVNMASFIRGIRL